MLRFFSYSFTASDGSEETTAGRVVSPCSIKVHHGFRSKEARPTREKKYRLRQTASHSSQLFARQGDVSRKLNQAFLLVDWFNFNLVDEERSDTYRQLAMSDISLIIHYVNRELLSISTLLSTILSTL